MVVCLWLCVCGCVFVVVFVIMCLWLCVCGCVCGYVFVIVVAVVCCGSGPAEKNAWSSQLRSGGEHWARMVVVEVRQGTLGVDGRG